MKASAKNCMSVITLKRAFQLVTLNLCFALFAVINLITDLTYGEDSAMNYLTYNLALAGALVLLGVVIGVFYRLFRSNQKLRGHRTLMLLVLNLVEIVVLIELDSSIRLQLIPEGWFVLGVKLLILELLYFDMYEHAWERYISAIALTAYFQGRVCRVDSINIGYRVQGALLLVYVIQLLHLRERARLKEIVHSGIIKADLR